MKILTCVVTVAVLAGCASAPPPPIHEPYPEAVQNKAMVAQHWGAIAADVAAQTKRNQADKDFLQERPLYVAPASTLPFDQAFTNFMITALVEAGLPVSMQPEGAVEIRYETQLIRHNLEFDPRKQGYVPGAPTTIGANFWVLRNAGPQPPPESSEPDPAKEDPRSRMRPSSVEMLITTSIVDNDQYLQRSTDAYYIEKADTDLFEIKNIEAKPRVYREWNVESK
jgi:hypothetical protein